MNQQMTGQLQVASASRRGIHSHNGDAAATHRVPGTEVVGAAVVDGIGNSPDVAEFAWLAAQVAARVGARTTATLGILAAAELNAAPAASDIETDGVAVVAVAEPGSTSIAWTGDCRAYGWTGEKLELRTTDDTIGEYLRAHGVPVDVAAQHDDRLRTSLGRSTVATVHFVVIEDRLVVLTSDGVHDSVPHEALEVLVLTHQDDPQALADAIVEAACENGKGYRDDATAVVMLRPRPMMSY
ncbi:PP2C family protein-serine/threonine phosphatase [Sphaerisporangium aureirubrum]|uniref:PP2C family protein-serine/threonine phosphatase n=1 Tax=Sphaerisporangium aureirubrum TaxID=1544736 RepID=A0ABW1NC13_9ACTN